MKRVYYCKGIVTNLLFILFLIIVLPICVSHVKVSAAIDNTDNTPPVIHNISIDKSGMSVRAGDKVKIKAKVTDDKTKVVSVSIYFKSYNSNNDSYVTLTYNAVTDEFEGAISIQETTQAGLWKLDQVYAYDEMGNRRYFSRYDTSSIPFDTSELRFVVLKNGATVINPYYIELGKTSVVFTEIGETETVPIIILPKDASNQNIVWTSDNPAVATVTGSAISAVTGGAITAVANGKAKITATTVDGGYSASCDVTVNIINGIQLSKDKITLTDTSLFRLMVTVIPDNTIAQDIIWESDNLGIVSVDQYGYVRPVSNGTAVVTAKTANGKYSNYCEVIVNIVSQISMNKDSIVLNKLLSIERLQVTTVPEGIMSNEDLYWNSSDSSIVSLDYVNKGVIQARKKGTAVITVSTADGRLQDSCTVTVDIPEGIDNADIEAPVIVSAKIDEAGEAVKVGDTIYIRIKAVDAKSEITSMSIYFRSKTTGANRYLSGSSYDSGIYYDAATDEYVASFTVDDKMVVGIWYCSSIQATDMMDNQLYYSPYRFFPSWRKKDPDDLNYYSKEDLRFIVLKNDGSSSEDAVQGVELKEEIDDTVYTFKNKGETITLHADVLPTTAMNKNVVWSSSDSSKATVDAYGNVTAISNGLATITATTVEGGYTSKCSVYVSIPASHDSGTSSSGGSFGGGTNNPAMTVGNTPVTETTITEGDTVTTIRTTEKEKDNGMISVTEEKTISNSDKGISLGTTQITEKDTEGNIANQSATTTVTFTKLEVGAITNSGTDDEEQKGNNDKENKGNTAFVRMEFPTEMLMKENEGKYGGAILQVKTIIPPEAVIDQLNSNDNSSVLIEYMIDLELLDNPSIDISEILMKKEILEAAKESGKSLTVSVKDDQGNECFSWTFDGRYLGESKNEIYDMNLAIGLVDLMDNKFTSKLLGEQDKVNGLLLNLEASGLLPAPVSTRVFIGERQGLKPEEKVYVYIADPVTGKLKSIVGGHGYKIDEQGYLTLGILENTDYVILPDKADSNIIESLRDQINVNEKITLKSGVKDKVIVNLPASLKLEETITKENSLDAMGSVKITYKSCDESIVRINEKTGDVTAVSQGKAKINIVVTLYSGKVKSLTTEIEVVY